MRATVTAEDGRVVASKEIDVSGAPDLRAVLDGTALVSGLVEVEASPGAAVSSCTSG